MIWSVVTAKLMPKVECYTQPENLMPGSKNSAKYCQIFLQPCFFKMPNWFILQHTYEINHVGRLKVQQFALTSWYGTEFGQMF